MPVLAEISEKEVQKIRKRLRTFRRRAGSPQDLLGNQPKCEVRKSPKRGLGLFATKSLRSGEIITLYPADGVSVYFDCDCGRRAAFVHTFPGMDAVMEAVYSMDVPAVAGRKCNIVGNPNDIDDPAYLGHMANDVAQLKTTASPQEITIYERVAEKGANAVLCIDREDRPTAALVVARRNIQSGEEIFVSYGAHYWITTTAFLEQAALTSSASSHPSDRVLLNEMD